MKILMVARIVTSHGTKGGMEVSARRLTEDLVRGGHEVSLLTTPGLDGTGRENPYANTWCVKGARSGKYSLRWWVGSRRHKQSQDWHPDLILSISSAATAFRRGRSGSIVAQCHGTAWAEVKSSLLTGGAREYLKVVLNSARVLREVYAYHHVFSQVWAVSDEVERQLRSRPYAVDPGKIVTIPNAVDSDAFAFDSDVRTRTRASWKVADDACVGLSLGRLHSQKGVDIAIEALTYEGSTERHLVVAGSGPEESKLRGLAAALGVGDRVIFLGHISRDKLVDVLSAADTLVFPTRRSEGLPLSLLEAIASGLPVLTTPQCNVPVDIQESVHIVEASGTAVAAGWPVRRTDEQRSNVRIPKRYEVESMSAAYLAAASETGRRSR